MKGNKNIQENNRCDMNSYGDHKKKKSDVQQQASKISKSFDQASSEAENNNANDDDSFYDWNKNGNLEKTNIDRVKSDIPQTRMIHAQIENEEEGEETKTPEDEDKQRNKMFQQYEMRKEEPSLVSEYVVGSSPKDESSSEQSIEEKIKEASSQHERNIRNVNLEVNNNQNLNINQNIESSKYIYSSEIQAHIRMKEQELKKTISLNIIVIGKTGIGKSTFIEAFLNEKFEKLNNEIRPTTIDIIEKKAVRKENGITLNLNMIDTPGYDADTQIAQWQQKIIGYITSKFEKFKQVKKEQDNKDASKQQEIQDQRVHGCLYFLCGPRINKVDLDNLKKLQEYVSIIPILARGDSYTPEEVKQYKKQLRNDADQNKIFFFDPQEVFQDQPEKLNKLLKSPFGSVPPFLIISSIKQIQKSENQVFYGREYKWGICDIKNPEHSDFMLLYTSLIGYFSTKLIKLADVYQNSYFNQKKKQQKIKEKENKIEKGILFAGLFSAAAAYIYTKFQKN
ncbi:septin protein (macronuclear) [Tetrahymena thermophila SB210]|uniref:Septin protein n=1 Tax=Tetrahymena thermophila (strain SB210) TaxID=312017 RepID=Q247T9_TETTS|nr:septin protein [Tetrahymena thermophila SB210]EAS04011.2 septin protein [Tetrahymena thermophila SB210]|eukprot:XP_001024256.2 septin protein [Tetrahymena thermophila SB210]